METIRQMIRGTAIAVPRTLNQGRYHVDSILTAGGQGFVLIARDVRLAGNRVLIKAPLYNLDDLALGEFGFKKVKRRRLNMVLEEIGMVDRVNTRVQNVPRIVDYFEDDNLTLQGTHKVIGGQETWSIRAGEPACRDLFVVYELLSGGRGQPRTLEDVILGQDGGLSERFVLEMAAQIVAVLHQLHWQISASEDEREENPNLERYYYLFQDLKPANIIVTGESDEEPYAFLIDFGGVVQCNILRGQGVEIEGRGAFTQGYAAPEYFVDQRSIDQQFDIFTLGATMFHAFTGIHPAELVPDPQGTGGESLAPRFEDKLFNRVAKFREAQTPLLREIIFRATRPTRGARYRNIRQMQSDIRLALKEL